MLYSTDTRDAIFLERTSTWPEAEWRHLDILESLQQLSGDEMDNLVLQLSGVTVMNQCYNFQESDIF